MYQALYRKWRPRTFDDVVGQSHITDTLKRQVESGRLSHAYLFTGTRGTGKTTCAKILARAVNCERPVNGNPCNECDSCVGIENGSILDVLELDAASNNGVDQVRALRDEAVYTPAAVRKRVYIVDEVHMLSTAAFNALLKILEEPPEHLMFILATTELHKVPATIKSRCQQFSFQRILPVDIAARLLYVAGEEGIELTSEGAELLARLADGGMRDALSLLDQCSGTAGAIGEQQVLDSLGLAGNLETARLMGHVAGCETEAALEDLARLYGGGKDVSSVLGELSSLARDLLIRKTAPRSGSALLNGGYDEATMRGLSERLQVPRLTWMLTLLQGVLADLPRSNNRRTDAELCLIRLCDERLDDSAQGMNARLARIEAQLSGGFVPVQAAAVPAATAAPTVTAAPAAAPKAETPPWDVEPQRERAERPAQPAPQPKPVEQPRPVAEVPAPEPLKPAAQPIAAPVGDILPTIAPALKNQVPRVAYSYLCNQSMVSGFYESGVFTLWTEDRVAHDLLGKQAVLEAVSAAVSARIGSQVRAVIREGKPEVTAEAAAQAADEHDNLDDLLAFSEQFDNITVQE